MEQDKKINISWPLQSFVLHNLNVNDKLYKWKLIETCLCSYCFTEPETIAHLFCDCFIVKNFYFKVVEWMRSYHIYLPSVSESSIVFGYFEGTRLKK